MFKRLDKKQLSEILKRDFSKPNPTHKKELREKIKNLQKISRKWDVIGALWELQIRKLEEELNNL